MPDFTLEAAARLACPGGRIAGVDEAGRGPLAGPVLAAAVVFPHGVPPGLARLLDDSKALRPAARAAAFTALQAAHAAGLVEFGIAAASVAEIARLNILRASLLAMARAVARLPTPPGLALVDGNQPPRLPCLVRCVVRGDSLSLSIAAASILAKVVRDRAMARLDRRWPAYGFAAHAGYATLAHRNALARHGPCPHHRRGFSPVDQAVSRFD